MHNLKKILAALLALVMIMGLMACGGKEKNPAPSAPAADGQEITETPAESIGSVTLVGTTRLTLHYNADGNVVTITNQEDVACYSLLAGTACADAAAQIIKEAEGPFAESFLLIKQESSTLVPNETFLQDIVAKAQAELGDLPVILSSAMDQNSQGYFSAETAQAVLAAYLGNPADAEYAVDAEPVDGYYSATVLTPTSAENYTVGALYGAVELQTEAEEEIFEGSDEIVEPDPGAEDQGELEQPQNDSEDPAEDVDVPVDDFVEEPTEEIIG